ncbi:DUF2808 domain-containing protein [Pseudanabaena sp. FACHB-1998]|uniref:DUF2808 domain-containing protein n=1 Tax=Pseudanabaena sp. FACHB-1998 TaxID=2692858 RepID=UPI0016807829|nr:DUF2808 domain-containing protein [Pseudanabaena sp. FACHB-1998]MBD2178937.1 DUF2808 domain-containing protein [Pseudanabaena sp. FACHB-1998]
MHKKVMSAIALLPLLSLPILTFNSQNLGFNPLNTQISRNFIQDLLIPSAGAVQLRDGKTYFVQLPTLLYAETTINRTNAWGATYYFVLDLPQNLGEPLQKLEISQAEGFETLNFIGNDTFAYLQPESGDRVSVPTKMEISPSSDGDRPKVVVTFDPPLPASNGLTRRLVVGLRPVRNPRYDGVYLFGVVALPKGDRPNSQFLGYGRLNFYSSRH